MKVQFRANEHDNIGLLKRVWLLFVQMRTYQSYFFSSNK